jgi:iron complex outermembrane receptor protein
MSAAFVSHDPDTTYGTSNPVNDLDLWGVGLTVNKQMGPVELVSITGVRGFQAKFGRDGDGTPIVWNQSLDDDTQRQISQELRLDGDSFDNRLKWTSGLFYFHEKNIDRNDVLVVPGLYTALERLPVQLTGAPCAAPFLAPGCAGNPLNPNLDLAISAYNRVVGDSYAAFGQGTFAVTDALNVTGGLRYSYESKRYTIQHFRRVSQTYIVPRTTLKDHWSSLTPMGSVDYTVVPDVMAYASVARGFKSGGFNGRPLDNNGVQAFGPENVTSYEVGVKSEWLDRRLRLNAAAFYSDYTDLQFTANVFSSKTNSLAQVIENAGKARIKGLEAELQARPIPALMLQASAGYTNFRITELSGDVQGVTLASHQPRTPKFNASAAAAYTIDLDPAQLTARLDWIYEGASYADIQNTPELRKPPSHRFNARLTYVSGDGNWEVALYGLNLTDRRYIISGLSLLDSFGHAEGTYNRPREWGLSVKRSF